MANVDYENKYDPRYNAERGEIRQQGAALGVPMTLQLAAKQHQQQALTLTASKAKVVSEREVAKMTSLELCAAVDYLIADMKEYCRVNKLPYPDNNWAHRRAVGAAAAMRKMWSQ